MKLGFDIHGVLDTFEVFQEMAQKCAADDNCEVHVISGLQGNYLEEEIGHLIDLTQIDNFFSITDYLIEKGAHIEWKDGLPWADEEEWNMAKAAYCRKEGIDVLYDDSPKYASYFDHIDTIYCQIHNPHRRVFFKRDQAQTV